MRLLEPVDSSKHEEIRCPAKTVCSGGSVVRKAVSANPGLKVKLSFGFSCSVN